MKQVVFIMKSTNCGVKCVYVNTVRHKASVLALRGLS